MNSQSEIKKLTFDELCEKIASGQASQEEIKKAFGSLDQDIEKFSGSVKKQLDDINK